MTPKFFEFVPQMPTDDDRVVPWIMRLDVAVEPLPDRIPCARCGARPMRYHGPGIAERASGSCWADIIGAAGGPGRIVSKRVIDGLSTLGATGFIAAPVTITSVVDPRLLKLPRPDYFYLATTGRIDIDWKRSGLNEPCLACGAPTSVEIKPPERLYPLQQTWDGSDLFYGRPYGGPFCTHRVLMLAREQRWTNFRFYSIDRTDYERGHWDGIDYLGSKWPPQWHADSPSVGKTLEEWLEEYFSIQGATQADYYRYQIAARALDDLGDEALLHLIERLNRNSLRAAQAIRSIAQCGTLVNADILTRAEQAVWAEESKINPHLFERDGSGLLRHKKLT